MIRLFTPKQFFGFLRDCFAVFFVFFLGVSRSYALGNLNHILPFNIFGIDDRTVVSAQNRQLAPRNGIGFFKAEFYQTTDHTDPTPLETHCTAFLIDSKFLLTAAHCLYPANYENLSDEQSEAAYTAALYYFLPSASDVSTPETASHSYRQVLRVLRKGIESPLSSQHPFRAAQDWALLEMVHPTSDQFGFLSQQLLTPTSLEEAQEHYSSIIVTGHAHSRDISVLLEQSGCHIQGARGSSWLTECDTETGTSGSPVWSLDSSGTPHLLGIYSAEGRSRTYLPTSPHHYETFDHSVGNYFVPAIIFQEAVRASITQTIRNNEPRR